MGYLSNDDFKFLYSKWEDHLGDLETAEKETAITLIINKVQGIIDSELGGIYKTPFEPIPEIIGIITLWYTKFLLSSRNGIVTESIKLDYELAEATIKKLKEGRNVLKNIEQYVENRILIIRGVYDLDMQKIIVWRNFLIEKGIGRREYAEKDYDLGEYNDKDVF